MRPHRWLPVVLVVCGVTVFWGLGLDRHLSLEALADHRRALLGFVADYRGIADLAYILALTAVAAFSIPAVAVMLVIGGFLFGPVFGTLYAVIGQTGGAVIVFLTVRLAFRDMVKRVPATMLRRLEAGFARDGYLYMIALRLAPFLPASMVNPLPALLGVRLKVFFLGTLIGVVPTTIVFASIGNGLGALIDSGRTPDMGIMTRPDILFPLLALSLLSLAPVAVRRARAWRRLSQTRAKRAAGLASKDDTPPGSVDTSSLDA